LLAQDYGRERCEILVVDNNSTDDTVEIAARHPVKVLQEREKQGPGPARNRGIQAAQGQVLAFLDADCIAEPGWLSALVPALSDPEVGAVGGHTEAYDPATPVERFFAARNPLLMNFRETYVALVTCNLACKRALVESLGGFDESLLVLEDLDLGWRMQAEAGKRIVYAPEARVFHCYRASIPALFHTYRRYGLSEIMVDTIYRGQIFCPRTPRQQLRSMLRQVGAAITYTFSFAGRCLTWPIHRHDRGRLLSPLLALVAECGSLWGKAQGLVSTRFFRRNPFGLQATGRPFERRTLFQRR
jgi:cellulose synthase/poly-beta-1,6-N-acetylglucosamine synthase-like glycosyltransferase